MSCLHSVRDALALWSGLFGVYDAPAHLGVLSSGILWRHFSFRYVPYIHVWHVGLFPLAVIYPRLHAL